MDARRGNRAAAGTEEEASGIALVQRVQVELDRLGELSMRRELA